MIISPRWYVGPAYSWLEMSEFIFVMFYKFWLVCTRDNVKNCLLAAINFWHHEESNQYYSQQTPGTTLHSISSFLLFLVNSERNNNEILCSVSKNSGHIWARSSHSNALSTGRSEAITQNKNVGLLRRFYYTLHVRRVKISAVEITKATTTTTTVEEVETTVTTEGIQIPTLLIGLPTVKRNGEEYLSDTLGYLLEDLSGFREKFSQSLQITLLLYAGGMFKNKNAIVYFQARMMIMQTSWRKTTILKKLKSLPRQKSTTALIWLK